MFQITSKRSIGQKNRMPLTIFHDEAIDLFESVFGLTEFFIQIRIRINNHGTFFSNVITVSTYVRFSQRIGEKIPFVNKSILIKYQLEHVPLINYASSFECG